MAAGRITLEMSTQHPPCQVRELLDRYTVRYKQLPDYPNSAPSSRVPPGAYVFPGSRSDFNHVIYLTERSPMLAVAYSKNTVFAAAHQGDTERALANILNVNATEPLAIWKLEDRDGWLYPVLEMSLFQSIYVHSSLQDLIWSACGTLDALYKATLLSITSVVLAYNSTEVAKQVKAYLQQLGYKKIKESSIPAGISFLVVMSSDEEPEETKWKRFPMKIDVTGILAFRIYFSLEDAAVTARGHFKNPAKLLIAELNSLLPIGYFNYSSGSDQIQLTLKLHYKTLCTADLAASVKAYYEACVLQYKWTAAALAALHEDAEKAICSLSEVSRYKDLLNEEMQGEFQWIRAERGQGQLIKRLEESELPYLLQRPIYRVEAGEMRVKTSRFLLPIGRFTEKYPLVTGHLMQLLLELYHNMVTIEVFPTLDMIFCQSNCSMPLRIVPHATFHSDKSLFLAEIVAFGLQQLGNVENLAIIDDIVELNWGYLDKPSRFEADGMVVATLGEQRCLLYPLSKSPATSLFARNYCCYKSLLGHLKDYPNPLQGWTEAPADLCNAEDPLDSQYYMCERYDYELTTLTALSVVSKAAKELEQLHAAGYCHWFISPVTIRTAGNQEIAIVLPCLSPAFSSFIFSFLPEQGRAFIAPEVRRYLSEGVTVADPYSADVYSLCRVISSHFGVLLESTSALGALRDLVIRGTNEKSRLRPLLREVISQLRI